jgi:inorganic pyrophosphatase
MKEHDWVYVFIEIPRGSRNKYEWDPRLRVFRLDRVLYSSVHYPTDYGIIPGTHAPDGDHLDALVTVEEPNFPGTLVRARPIALLRMRDEKGNDEKILAVPKDDPRFDTIHNCNDLPPHWLREIEAFFATYKLLQGIETETCGWSDAAIAWEIIDRYTVMPAEEDDLFHTYRPHSRRSGGITTAAGRSYHR